MGDHKPIHITLTHDGTPLAKQISRHFSFILIAEIERLELVDLVVMIQPQGERRET
jgi:hypothetical protein